MLVISRRFHHDGNSFVFPQLGDLSEIHFYIRKIDERPDSTGEISDSNKSLMTCRKKRAFLGHRTHIEKKTVLVENFAETSQRNRKFSLEAESVFIVMYLFFRGWVRKMKLKKND
jgi:hypothetical protein